MLHTNTTLN